MKTSRVLALFSFLPGLCLAQIQTQPTPEQVVVIANDRAYEEAYAKADVQALVSFFAADAEYTAEDGGTYSGLPEIEEAIRNGLRANPGSVLAIHVDSVRALALDVLLEKGTTEVTARSGETSGAHYTAVHVKRDGSWKISELVERPLSGDSPRQHLSELAWLTGKWEESDPSNDLVVESQYSWARGGSFLTRNVKVTHRGEVTLEGWQIIGWDPLEEQIRSWTFDTGGGFAGGLWTREGDRWLIRETGVAPGGNRTAADNTLTKLSADRLAWESNNRFLDGEPQPGIDRIEAARREGE